VRTILTSALALAMLASSGCTMMETPFTGTGRTGGMSTHKPAFKQASAPQLVVQKTYTPPPAMQKTWTPSGPSKCGPNGCKPPANTRMNIRTTECDRVATSSTVSRSPSGSAGRSPQPAAKFRRTVASSPR